MTVAGECEHVYEIVAHHLAMLQCLRCGRQMVPCAPGRRGEWIEARDVVERLGRGA
jgi:hypothetical protein